MDLRFIPVLADAMSDYFEFQEARDLCGVFDVGLDWAGDGPAYMQLARQLIAQPDHGNNHRLLEALVDTLVSRSRRGVANNSFERQEHHRRMLQRLEELEQALAAEGGLPAEINAPENNPFTAKSKVREFLGASDTAVLIVDNYVGVGTLDCLRDVKQPIRILAGTGNQCVETGFERALNEFRAEGYQVEVRRHPKLHDRYLSLADRVWLLGSSLKDAGKKAFNGIELIDGKAGVIADVEAKWNVATPL
jgi:hypothetical protein